MRFIRVIRVVRFIKVIRVVRFIKIIKKKLGLLRIIDSQNY